MNIFSEVKEQLTTRQVAESYGLRIRKNGVACCPFHDDRHPSMKVDKNYHCFAWEYRLVPGDKIIVGNTFKYVIGMANPVVVDGE